MWNRIYVLFSILAFVNLQTTNASADFSSRPDTVQKSHCFEEMGHFRLATGGLTSSLFRLREKRGMVQIQFKVYPGEKISPLIRSFPELAKKFTITYEKSSSTAWVKIPGTRLFNYIFERLEGSRFERPYRFRDWFPKTSGGETQTYPQETFVENIGVGKILLATGDYLFSHDRLEDHMVGVLLMPPRVFSVMQSRAKLLLLLEKLLPSKKFKTLYMQSSATLSRVWDDGTDTAGNAIAARNFKRELNQNSQTDRNLKLMLLGYQRMARVSLFWDSKKINNLNEYRLDVLSFLDYLSQFTLSASQLKKIEAIISATYVEPPTDEEIVEYLQTQL